MNRPILLGALAALASTVAAGTAMAQPRDYDRYAGYDSASYDDPIVVSRPHAWRSGRSSSTGAPIENSIAQARVAYSDLDLRTDEGRYVLMARVSSAARRVCRRLDMISPPSGLEEPRREDCEADAVRSARPQLDDAIYNAGY